MAHHPYTHKKRPTASETGYKTATANRISNIQHEIQMLTENQQDKGENQ